MNDEIIEILIFIENKIYPKESLLFEKWSFLKNYITNLQKEKEDYKSRVEKAVEYIKTIKFLYKSHYDFKQDLLNILQNGSEK